MPKLEYGQCYGYVPALSLGGKASNNNTDCRCKIVYRG